MGDEDRGAAVAHAGQPRNGPRLQIGEHLQRHQGLIRRHLQPAALVSGNREPHVEGATSVNGKREDPRPQRGPAAVEGLPRLKGGPHIEGGPAIGGNRKGRCLPRLGATLPGLVGAPCAR